VEMALVMTIISVVIGMSVSAGMTQLEVARNGSTKSTMENIRQALLVYHKKKGRYPCPADPTLLPTDANYGAAASTCTAGCGANNLVCIGDAVIGAVPFAEIKLNPESAVDAWDRQISYVVDKDHTEPGAYYTLGDIKIQDAGGKDITVSPTLGDAIFVLISHGSDGSGAYIKETGVRVACVAGQADTGNCDDLDDIFIDDRLMTNSDLPASYFDDIVIWQAQENLDINNTIAQNNDCDVPLSAGYRTSCAIASTGTPYCWGNNTHGSFGNGGTSGTNFTPATAFAGGTDWVSFSSRYSDGVNGHSCGIHTNGNLFCAGENGSGQLGNGTTVDSTSPVQESIGVADWVRVVVGERHTCATRSNGRLFCWGYNASGQVGNATFVNQENPKQVGSDADWTDFTLGAEHSCGIRNNGEAYCWGENSSFQLGDGTGSTADSNVPVLVANGSNWVSISASKDHTCALTQTGHAWCWGKGGNGRLGDNGTTNKNTPVEVQGSYADWTEISAGYAATCGIRAGHLWCWGNRSDYIIPDGGATSGTQMTPVEELSLFDDWLNISIQQQNACAIRTTTGKFYCWGLNDKGQVGDGVGTTATTSPTEVSTIIACDP